MAGVAVERVVSRVGVAGLDHRQSHGSAIDEDVSKDPAVLVDVVARVGGHRDIAALQNERQGVRRIVVAALATFRSVVAEDADTFSGRDVDGVPVDDVGDRDRMHRGRREMAGWSSGRRRSGRRRGRRDVGGVVVVGAGSSSMVRCRLWLDPPADPVDLLALLDDRQDGVAFAERFTGLDVLTDDDPVAIHELVSALARRILAPGVEHSGP